MRDVCVRTELCTRWSFWDRTGNMLMLRVPNYGCTAYAANAYTIRDIEYLFPGTQWFVQARNKKCLQQFLSLDYIIFDLNMIFCLKYPVMIFYVPINYLYNFSSDFLHKFTGIKHFLYVPGN